MVASTQKTVKPNSGESYRDFVFRAHQVLMPSMPSYEARNKAVWNAWDNTHGNPIREQAQQYHAKDCSRFVPDVCYFMEHETIGSDGQPVKYGFKELADICEEMNGRCDTHNYSAIADRHTIRGMVPENLQPKVVGYTGATRLGMVGSQNPKWAVFMDEHHLTSGVSTLDDKKRRSVEVNRFRDGRRPYFDPIAALGADSPRLPLPVAKYSANDGDPNHIIDHYESPAMVGAGNTFIPAMSGKKVDQYEDTTLDPGTQSMMAPEDVNAIIQALFATPEFQFVQTLMHQSQAGAQPAQPGQPQPGQPQPAAQPHAGQPSPQPQHQPSQEPTGGPTMANPNQPKPNFGGNQYSNQGDPGVTVDQYQQLVDENTQLREQYSAMADQYTALAQNNKQLVQEMAQANRAIANMEMRVVDGDRSQKINELYQQYPHFVVAEEELDKVLYSRGSEMDSEQFEAHVAQLEVYAQRSSPVSKMVPRGSTGGDQYSQNADIEQLVVDRYTAYADEGILKTYEEVKREVTAELKAGKV
jgi:hypothetical protein